MDTPLPCTAYHEGAGTVVAKGSSQTDDFLGVKNHGFFAQYAKIDAEKATKLPDNVSFETTAPLACRGEWIVSVGSGDGLGHLGVQFAKATGLNVVGIDARDEGLELTWQCGADIAIDARTGHKDVVKAVHACTNNEGVVAALNVSDASSAVAGACAITKMHGTMIQIAQPDDVVISYHDLIFRDIRVRGSVIYPAGEARHLLELVAEHGTIVQTNAFQGLGEIEKLIELAHGGEIKEKGVVIMDQEQIEEERKLGAGL
ncbi:alcohol dehydrogenase, propanol-preferring [Alternaria panax]|uniref:Alcohol dehydrogenase, propanol-preferring n=1 Tax=Alternaria panax TaxID=48097 RepID=A0AAD4IKN9_9PLEO|nr:alcohol dehydrogenase, propanol-preferring [Alternaria panax]